MDRTTSGKPLYGNRCAAALHREPTQSFLLYTDDRGLYIRSIFRSQCYSQLKTLSQLPVAWSSSLAENWNADLKACIFKVKSRSASRSKWKISLMQSFWLVDCVIRWTHSMLATGKFKVRMTFAAKGHTWCDPFDHDLSNSLHSRILRI